MTTATLEAPKTQDVKIDIKNPTNKSKLLAKSPKSAEPSKPKILIKVFALCKN